MCHYLVVTQGSLYEIIAGYCWFTWFFYLVFMFLYVCCFSAFLHLLKKDIRVNTVHIALQFFSLILFILLWWNLREMSVSQSFPCPLWTCKWRERNDDCDKTGSGSKGRHRCSYVLQKDRMSEKSKQKREGRKQDEHV